MCPPPRLSRTFKRNFTLSHTFLKTYGWISLHSRLILLLGSSIESTAVVYAFSFKYTNRKSCKELNQVNELPTQQGHSFQSNFRASSCPNTFSREMNNLQAHHPDEKYNWLLSKLNVGRHIELICFCSSRRSHFDLGRSMGQYLFF